MCAGVCDVRVHGRVSMCACMCAYRMCTGVSVHTHAHTHTHTHTAQTREGAVARLRAERETGSLSVVGAVGGIRVGRPGWDPLRGGPWGPRAQPTNLEPSAGRSVLFRAGPPGGPFPQGFPSSRRLSKG